MRHKFVTFRIQLVALGTCFMIVSPVNEATLAQYNIPNNKISTIAYENVTKENKTLEVEPIRETTDIKYTGEVPSPVANVQLQPSMIQIAEPDINYISGPVMVNPAERELLERLVQGESGGISVEAAALVAQCIRDAMVYKGYRSIEQIRVELKYSGSLDNPPNTNTIEAVHRVFDLGESAVQHKIFYFYAPAVVNSRWHETQKFIIEYGGHKFFDEVPMQ